MARRPLTGDAVEGRMGFLVERTRERDSERGRRRDREIERRKNPGRKGSEP